MLPLLHAYRSQEASLMAFYGKSPAQLFTAPAGTPTWSPALRDVLNAYQEQLGLKRRIRGDEWVIVTGQQPGLFTGPLYTIYKAITAIQLAEACQARTGVPHLPVYWVAGDDHDFEEVRNSHFLTRNDTLHRYRFTPDGASPQALAGLPMFRMTLDASLHDAVDAVSRRVRHAETGATVRELLHDTLSAANSLADWHARLMAALFRDTPLCIFAPHLDAARQAAKPVIAREIAAPLASTALLNEAGGKLAALGYDAQVVKAPEECNFFLFVEEKRRKVLFRRGEYHVPEAQQRYRPEEMSELLESTPEAFSPNVALRCIVQQALFPTRGYVAGPGELAYWAQLKPLFKAFDHPMPAVYPRAQAYLLPEKTARLRARYALQHADFTQPFQQLMDAALTTLPPISSQEDFHRHHDALRAQAGSMLEAIRRASPSQRRAQHHAEHFAQAFDYHLRKLERGLLRGEIERNNQVQAHLTRLVNTLAPYQKPQERVLNVFSFLFTHGLELIPELTETLQYDAETIQEVIL